MHNERLRVARANSSQRNRWIPWLCLAVAVALTAFSNGRRIIPAAAWVAPIFMLSFTRKARPWGLVAGFAAYAVAHLLMYESVIPLRGIAFVFVIVGIAALYFIPYLIDRALYRLLPAPLSVLVFPLAWTAIEYASASANPYGTWASIAYTQDVGSAFVQLGSITGIWGIAFAITAFAPTVLYAMEAAKDRTRSWRPVAIYAIAIAGILCYGGARLWFVDNHAQTVRVAGIARPQAELADERAYYLERSAEAASAGAQIVVWPECAVSLAYGDEENAYMADCAEFARARKVYLAASVSVMGKIPGGLYENKIAFIGPDGAMIAEYVKARPVPGERCVAGSGEIPSYSTPYGRIGLAICFDLDFPPLTRQVSASKTDILIVPSSDWDAIDPLHTNMALFRSIENGCAQLRVAGVGRSVAADARGAVIAQSDSFSSDGGPLIASIPITGVSTVYSVIGDVFALLCVSALSILIVFAIVSRKRDRKITTPQE